MGFCNGGGGGHGQCVSPAGTWNLPCRTAFPLSLSLSRFGWWGPPGLRRKNGRVSQLTGLPFNGAQVGVKADVEEPRWMGVVFQFQGTVGVV
jgi:hypothetical protein